MTLMTGFYIFLAVFVVCLSLWGAYTMGQSSGQTKSYFNGRLAGWRACENMVIKRAMESDKINLSKEELFEILLQ